MGPSLPTPKPRALPGLPCSQPYLLLDLGLALAPPRMGASIAPSLCLGWRGASLGCYTSRTETVLGPMNLVEEGPGKGVSGTYWGGGL